MKIFDSIDLLHSQKLAEPQTLLGLHENKIVLWRPGAKQIYLEVNKKICEAKKVDPRGLFIFELTKKITPKQYRIYHSNGVLAHDPYAFLPEIGSLDLFLFNKGCHYQLYEVLGSKFKTIHSVEGVQFSVWAPHALAVFLVADFNYFDGRSHPMIKIGDSGIWSLFVPGIAEGEKYKYEIVTSNQKVLLKADPYANAFEFRPKNACVVSSVDSFCWTDQQWIEKRKSLDLNRPINVYEVHLGSWKRNNGNFLSYRELALELGSYVKKMGFTHVELLPVMEHPLDESWGYQVSGYFAPTSRFGSVKDFQFFIDHMHQLEIGVILDWVPAHFPMDDFSLFKFDGTSLYEYAEDHKGYHPHWNTAIFDYGKNEVVNFLIASALFWIEKMHVDGLRVDAVASMLYLDYGRNFGAWQPNKYGSNLNLEAIEFLKHLNSIVHQRAPGVLMIAEESSAFQGVTHFEGLGFDLKWNMGWMNDTLRYFQIDPFFRKHHQNILTFSLLYAFSESFALALSHDEVVHLKKSLLGKMPGPSWQKFASLRLIYSYMICHPGKKLFFMGGELAQEEEWNSQKSLDWENLNNKAPQQVHKMISDLNFLYLKKSQLWQRDFDWGGFEWVDFSDSDFSVISYFRKAGKKKTLLVVHNFSPEFLPNYFLKIKNLKKSIEIFNSDAQEYGGSGLVNPVCYIDSQGLRFNLSPLATMIFEVELE